MCRHALAIVVRTRVALYARPGEKGIRRVSRATVSMALRASTAMLNRALVRDHEARHEPSAPGIWNHANLADCLQKCGRLGFCH
jgi:hypothetical protein